MLRPTVPTSTIIAVFCVIVIGDDDLDVPDPQVPAPAIAGAERASALTSAVAAATRRARCFRRPPVLPSCVFIFPSPSFLRAACAVPQ
jgi:hypothetical protein